MVNQKGKSADLQHVCSVETFTLATLTAHKRARILITDSEGEGAISGFRLYVDKICALLGYYAAYSGDYSPTFRDNLSVPSSRVNKGCLETSVENYQSMLRNIPEERRSQEAECSTLFLTHISIMRATHNKG